MRCDALLQLFTPKYRQALLLRDAHHDLNAGEGCNWKKARENPRGTQLGQKARENPREMPLELSPRKFAREVTLKSPRKFATRHVLCNSQTKYG
jgi:hypothetical protein